MIPYFTQQLHRKVVIYARVSTDHDAQLSALENPLDWYKPLLDLHPEWELVGQYIDEGIIGTSAQKRPEFMRMMEDRQWSDGELLGNAEIRDVLSAQIYRQG